jgi:hypothetical protein
MPRQDHMRYPSRGGHLSETCHAGARRGILDESKPLLPADFIFRE